MQPGLDEPHVGAAFMPDRPAFGDRAVEAGPVLVGTAAGLKERRVDQLDIDAAVLHRLDRARDLDKLPDGGGGIGAGAGSTNFISATLPVRPLQARNTT